jgi:signal transduction histidine kinase/CheY-like chemotaxis protein
MNDVKQFRPEEGDDASVASRLLDEQVAAVFRNVSVGVVAAACAALVLVGTLVHLGVLPSAAAAVWATSIIVCAGGHLVLRRAYGRAIRQERESRGWAICFTAFSLVEGILWGWLSISITDRSPYGLEMLVMVVVLTMAAGAIPAFGPYLPAFAALFLPATIPFAVANLLAGGALQEASAVLMLIYILGMGAVGLNFNANFAKLVLLRIETERLAESLREQKELAERASLEKSHFLASASHDLRQPVHALGLFVGALRGVDMPEAGTRLLDQVEASVIALDDLFSALLDISKLDAGIVQPRPQSFPIQPMLERIVRDHLDEAISKSIALVLHPCSAVVETDPVILERILRNLIANAVRYTDRGRVVVGCRHVKGALRIQVWDTGRGIPFNQRERIFEEFFQLENPERDRAKGLGLGLAIVRRLTGILHSPLTLESEPGRGSCFSVTVQKSVLPWLAPPTTIAPATAPGALKRGFVLVIDDETAIQQAMHSLLTNWGHTVMTAGSGDAMLEQLADCPTRPDLIISDYRLRGTETGLAVIDRLHAEYNDDIPALLITGETAPDRLLEARESGFLILHKPVSNSQLRAAIGNLIRIEEPQSITN